MTTVSKTSRRYLIEDDSKNLTSVVDKVASFLFPQVVNEAVLHLSLIIYLAAITMQKTTLLSHKHAAINGTYVQL